MRPDGAEVRNFAPQSGRIVVVGNDLLMEAILTSNRQPALIRYAPAGPNYVIGAKPRLEASLPWQAV